MQKKSIDLSASPSLKQQVYEILRMRIINGELAPGEKLHEEELSNEMGVSRAPLREALNMLDRDGFARIIPRRGAVVADILPEDISMLWDVRELLEPSAAVMSIDDVPAEVLQAVRADLDWVMQHPEDFQRYMESDIEVHALMIDYLKNHYLSSILKNIKDHSLRMRWNAERQSKEAALEIVQAADREHIEIVDAFQQKDKDRLYQAVKFHIQESRWRTMRRLVDEKEK